MLELEWNDYFTLKINIFLFSILLNYTSVININQLQW